MAASKTLAEAAAGVWARGFWAWFWVGQNLWGQERAWLGAVERVAKMCGYWGVYGRRAFYRLGLEGVGEDVFIGQMTVVSKRQSRIGDRVYIGRGCGLGWVDIEEDVMIADQVQVLSGPRPHGRSAVPGRTLRDNPQEYEKVTIGRGAWIGAGAIVMADVGPGAVVGAGAVVTRAVEPGERVAGSPARAIGVSGIAKAYT